MAIVWVHEALASGSGVGEHGSGGSYVRVFDVLSDSYDDNAITVAAANDGTTAIPAAYSYFHKGNDTDYQSVVTRIAPERDARYPLLWHVRVEYTVFSTSSGNLPGGTIAITSRLPDIRIWGIPVSEVIHQDVNGLPIANSAGQRFNPLPEDVYYLKAFEIAWPSRSYDLDFWTAYEDSVNADRVWGRNPGSLLMVGPPSATRKVDSVGTYWEMKAEIHWNKKGWVKQYIDMGKVKLVASDGSAPSANNPATGVMPITDQAGLRVGDDVPLDGAGQPLAAGQPWVIRYFTVKSLVAWAPLNLPALNITW